MPARPTTAAERAKFRRRQRTRFEWMILCEIGSRLTELRSAKPRLPRLIAAAERDYAAQLALVRAGQAE